MRIGRRESIGHSRPRVTCAAARPVVGWGMARRLLVDCAPGRRPGRRRAPGATREEASHAMGLWTPHPIHDTCSAAYHDSFSTLGTDGKRYPTWHPPEGDEQGTPCTFGHEHGRDPRGSALLADIEAQYGGVLFGFANQQLDEYNRAARHSDGMRHEDHVGHKIEWENDVELFESTTNGGEGRRALDIRCDFLMKIHQGTHSADAFTNNLHELLYAAQCRDRADGSVGTKLIAYTMVQFGIAGRVLGGRRRRRLRPRRGRTAVAAPVADRQRPALDPDHRPGAAGGAGAAGPGSDYSRGLYEDWISSNYLRKSGGRSRLPTSTRTSRCSCRRGSTGRPVSRRCRARRAPPATKRRRSVAPSTSATPTTGSAKPAAANAIGCQKGCPASAWDDPRSPFDGVKREFYFNQTTIVNAGNPTTWYTDPLRRSRQHEAVSRRDPPVRRRGRQPQAQRRRRDRRRRTHSTRSSRARSAKIAGTAARACTHRTSGDRDQGPGTRERTESRCRRCRRLHASPHVRGTRRDECLPGPWSPVPGPCQFPPRSSMPPK